jgi:hypothetical protein
VKLAAKHLARIDTALRDRDLRVRDELLAEFAAQAPEVVAALGVALQKQFEQQVVKLESSGLKKQFDRLLAQRDDLDRRRTAARDLNYDEQRYFYPYKPPEVSSDRYAEYSRVQAEIDRLVAALGDVWRDDRLRVRVSAATQAELERLQWMGDALARLGRPLAQGDDRIAWLRALPSGDAIGIREFCRDKKERDEIEEWRLIELYNAEVGKQFASAVREQLAVTNEYRAMFRHRPVALVAKVCAAAAGHAEEMSRLGYFAHFSPTPGRRTPYDRMKLAGYQQGVSENIALNDSAPAAHDAWCHSSGHHRNLLNPHHREIGIGVDGRNWVQNFGSGRSYEDDVAWPGAGRRVGRK